MKITDLQSALAKRNCLEKEITDLKNQAASQVQTLKRLEESGDLNNKKVLAEICETQVVVNLLPHRITARESALAQSEADLLAACNRFIAATLNPGARELASLARTKVKDSIGVHFSEAGELESAIDQSDLVKEVTAIGSFSICNNPVNGVVRFTESLLAAWASVEGLRAKTQDTTVKP